MYNSYPNQGSSAAKWIFYGFFGIIFMGFLLGVNIKDATWLNPNIAREEARRLEIENAHQQATYGLQERLAAAQTEAEIRQIQREQEKLDAQHAYNLQILDQDIANRQRWADVGINIVIFISGVTGLAAAISAIIVALAKAISILRTVPNTTPVIPAPRTVPEIQMIPSVPERQSYEPLDLPQQFVEDPSQLYEKRVAERFQEVTQQKKEASLLAARMKATIDPARMSNTEYHKRPLAGD